MCCSNHFLKHLFRQLPLGDSGYRSGHGNSEVCIDGNVELAAGHMDGDGGVAKPEFFSHGRGRAAAAARGQGVARPPLPDLDLDIVPIQDL